MTNDAGSAFSSQSPRQSPASTFRCIACGAHHETAAQNFRCHKCGDLLEITYPDWKNSLRPAATLKALWLSRRTSQDAIDQSGVWRFRELLPALRDVEQGITLGE